MSTAIGVTGEGGFVPAPVLAGADASIPTFGAIDGTTGFRICPGTAGVGVCCPILGTGTPAGGVGGLLTWILVGGACAVTLLLLPTGGGRGKEVSFAGAAVLSGKGACTATLLGIGAVVAFVPSATGIGLGAGGGWTILLTTCGTGRGAVGFCPSCVGARLEAGGGSTLLPTGGARAISGFSVVGTDFGDSSTTLLGCEGAGGNGGAGFVCSETGLDRKAKREYLHIITYNYRIYTKGIAETARMNLSLFRTSMRHTLKQVQVPRQECLSFPKVTQEVQKYRVSKKTLKMQDIIFSNQLPDLLFQYIQTCN